MELLLDGRGAGDVACSVICNGQHYHGFDPRALLPVDDSTGRPPHPLRDPAAYGAALYSRMSVSSDSATGRSAAGASHLSDRIYLATASSRR
jgi:hypothetical protein